MDDETWHTLRPVSVSVWEAIFMLVVLKIPIVYLCAVVLWAIRAEPRSDEGPETVHALVPLIPCGWDESQRRRSSRRRGRSPIRPTQRPRVGVSA